MIVSSSSISTGRTSQVMIHSKIETLILQVGGWGMRLTSTLPPPPKKKTSLFRRLIMDARLILLVNNQENVTG